MSRTLRLPIIMKKVYGENKPHTIIVEPHNVELYLYWRHIYRLYVEHTS